MTDSIELLPASKLTKKQVQKHQAYYTDEQGVRHKAVLEIRYDDSCGNGHNSFAMTVEDYTMVRGHYVWTSGGCQHDIAREHFPDFAHMIKWHLTSSDGPMHYVANTVYFAGDKDHNGKRAGEPLHFERTVLFGDDPVAHTKDGLFLKWLEEQVEKGVHAYEVVEVPHDNKPGETFKFSPKYRFSGFPGKKWYQCPFDTREEAEQWAQALYETQVRFVKRATTFSEGKVPQLEAARRAAVWPDATLEQLTDKEALIQRLPALMEEFKRDIEGIGLEY